MVLNAAVTEAWSHPPASGDQGVEVGVLGGGSWGGAGDVVGRRQMHTVGGHCQEGRRRRMREALGL
jgi:hypothetical protein